MALGETIGFAFVWIAPAAAMLVIWRQHLLLDGAPPHWRRYCLLAALGAAVVNMALFYAFVSNTSSPKWAIHNLSKAVFFDKCGLALSITGLVLALVGGGRRSRSMLVLGSLVALMVWTAMQVPLADWKAVGEAQIKSGQH